MSMTVCYDIGMIGKAIFDTIEEQQITTTEMAYRIGISEGCVRAYRIEKSLPSAKTLLRMMREFPTLAARFGFKPIDDVDVDKAA